MGAKNDLFSVLLGKNWKKKTFFIFGISTFEYADTQSFMLKKKKQVLN